MAPRRWLWPCSDSQVLRLPAYQKPSLHACLVHPDADDILVHDSDDDLDDDRHTAKRRRIEAIAHSFLNGHGIHIPSATLKGPFFHKHSANRDLSLCHDLLASDPAHLVSSPPTLNADTFLRRRPEHPRPKSTTPEPALTPSKLQPSSPVVHERLKSPTKSARSLKTKSLRFDLPSSATPTTSTVLPPLPTFLAINGNRLQPTSTPDKHSSSTDPSRQTNWSATRVPDSTFVSQSPAPSKIAASTPPPTKIIGVLRQRPAYALNKVQKAPTPAHKLPSVKKNQKPAQRVYQAAAINDTTSPFIYRKNAVQTKKTAVAAKEKSAEPESVARRPILPGRRSKSPVSPQINCAVPPEPSANIPDPESSHPLPVVEGTEQSSARPQNHVDVVPAINISFGQESFGMDFNVINHFNNSPPAPLMSRRGSEINGIMPDDHQASAVAHMQAADHQSELLQSSKLQFIETELRADFSNAHEQEPAVTSMDMHAKEDVDFVLEPAGEGAIQTIDRTMDDAVLDCPENDSIDEVPYISTQAAMQDAHRALFDMSSPVQPQEVAFDLPLTTPAKQVMSPPSSPVHTITPFHRFNSEFTTDTQAPLPNTQALFDDFYSPIKLSAKKPKMAKRLSFAPSVIFEDADDTVASISDRADGIVIPRQSQDCTGFDFNKGTASDEQMHSDVHTSPKLAADHTRTSSSSLQNRESLPPPRRLQSRSTSSGFVPSQSHPTSTKESSGSAVPILQRESIRLSEVFDFVSSRRGIDVETLLSQGTPNSSQSAHKKGRKSARSSQSNKRSRSSLSKSLSGKKVVQRRSLRLSVSQPNPQTDLDFATETDMDGPSATQPDPTPLGASRSSALVSPTIPDGSSTIPDPSLAFQHVQQHNTTSRPEWPALTPSSAPQSTGSFSSFQHGQKQYSNLTDLDSTLEDLPQTFLPSVH